jgi:hypothetical protein
MMLGDGSNRYLMEQESSQNYFNNLNNDKLFLGNSVQGVPSSSGENVNTDGVFRFVLPELKENDKFSPPAKSEEESLDLKSGAERKPKSKSSELESRSQLLRGREQNFRSQAGKALSKGVQPGLADDLSMQQLQRAAGEFQQPDALGEQGQQGQGQQGPGQQGPGQQGQGQQGPGQQGGGQQGPGQQGGGQQGGGALFEAMQQGQAPAQGLLSIDFQIPSAGTRHDFVRTGGNAALTLTVRSRETIDIGLGILWAVACLIAAVVLLKGVSRGSLLLRVCLLATIIGLLGWLCFPSPLRYLMLMVCVAASVCFCLGLIISSFRRPVMA